MIYIYDILLNFCDSNFVYKFYEWDYKQDNIENYKKVPMIRVSHKDLESIIKNDFIISKNILLNIYKKTELYLAKKIKLIDYICLFSDGIKTIAIEFDKDGKSIYRSNLLLDEESETCELAKETTDTDISLKIIKKIKSERNIIRNDLIIHNYLKKVILDSYKNENISKLKYIYQEYFNKSIDDIKQIKNELINKINIIDDKDIEIYNLLRKTKLKKQV